MFYLKASVVSFFIQLWIAWLSGAVGDKRWGHWKQLLWQRSSHLFSSFSWVQHAHLWRTSQVQGKEQKGNKVWYQSHASNKGKWSVLLLSFMLSLYSGFWADWAIAGVPSNIYYNMMTRFIIGDPRFNSTLLKLFT